MRVGGGKVLGVLGGMGPLASAYFMMRLTELTDATREQDHVPAILWSDPRVPDRIAAHRGTGESPLHWLVHGLQGLARAGCGAVAIPCNTAHGWIDGMRDASQVPILHIIDAAAANLRQLGVSGGTVGVLGKAPTLAMRLYQDRLGLLGRSVLEPDAVEMERLVIPAIAHVKQNRPVDGYKLVIESIERLRRRGADAVC
jgi:aspartate racemase